MAKSGPTRSALARPCDTEMWRALRRRGVAAMVAARATRRYTPAEYLALEQQAEWKHEYIDGCIVAMSCASLEHDRIAGDVYGELRGMLRGGPCDVFSSDVRVGNAITGRYTYPDVSVACGELLV